MSAAAPVERLFQALADPSRRGMVERLGEGPASVKQLAGPAGLGLPSAVKHLRVLSDCGLVVSEKAGRVRTFRLLPGGLAPIAGWVAAREGAARRALDRLAQAMQDLPEEEA